MRAGTMTVNYSPRVLNLWTCPNQIFVFWQIGSPNDQNVLTKTLRVSKNVFLFFFLF